MLKCPSSSYSSFKHCLIQCHYVAKCICCHSSILRDSFCVIYHIVVSVEWRVTDVALALHSISICCSAQCYHGLVMYSNNDYIVLRYASVPRVIHVLCHIKVTPFVPY